jgi:hypothetical protein
MGIVQNIDISLELEEKSYDEICSLVLFHKKYNIFFPLRYQIKSQRVKIIFLKPLHVYMENFSQNFPKNSFTEVGFPIQESFAKFPAKCAAGVRQNFSTYSIAIATNANITWQRILIFIIVFCTLVKRSETAYHALNKTEDMCEILAWPTALLVL